MRLKPSPALLLALAITLIAASCGVTREATEDVLVVAPAATLTFADGSTAEVPRSAVDKIVDQIDANPEASDLIFQGNLPANFNLDVLSSLIQIEVIQKALADEGGQVTDDMIQSELEVLDSQLDGLVSEEDNPAAALATIQTGVSEYLGMIARQRITQNTYTDLFLVEGDVEVPCSSHILLETEAAANDAIARLDAGEDFAELAMELSTGPSGPNGGDLGCTDPNGFVDEFRIAVEEATIGEVTGPVATQFGWHVILVTGTELAPANPGLAQQRAFEGYTAIQAATTVDIDPALGQWDPVATRVQPL